jgi:hypothetical protein
VNLERTRTRSPVNGAVTNLLVQRDDFATVGEKEISPVDADSFWVDAYFEETNSPENNMLAGSPCRQTGSYVQRWSVDSPVGCQ